MSERTSETSQLRTSARKNRDRWHSVAHALDAHLGERARSTAVPTPNQPGMPWRLCVHENTHGIARSDSSVSFAARDAGREPIGRCATSSIGVAATRVAREAILVGGQREVRLARRIGRARELSLVGAPRRMRCALGRRGPSTAPIVSSMSRSAIAGCV